MLLSFFFVSLYMCMYWLCTKASVNTYFVVKHSTSSSEYPSSSNLCSRKSAQAHLRQCNKLTLCSLECAFAVREENVIIFMRHRVRIRYSRRKPTLYFFFFQPLVYVHNQMYKCRLLITFENSSGPTKYSRENACMCRLVSAFAS